MTAPQQYQQPGIMPPVFIDVTVPITELGPGFDEIQGRPVAFVPKQLGETSNFDKTMMKPTVWFDMYVGGDAPIIFGAAPKATPPRPLPTHQIQAPCVFRNQMSNHTNIYRALAPALGSNSFVVGVMGTLNGGAYVIEKFDAGDPRQAAFQAQVTALVVGQTPEPQPQPINFGQPVAARQVAQPQYMPAQQSYAQAQPAPQYANTIPQAQQQPQMPPPMAAPQPIYQQPVPQAPVQTLDAVPPQLAATGMTPEFWATLAQPQRDMMLQMAAQAAAPAQQPANPY